MLGLLDKTADKVRGQTRHAGAAVRAHHQGEAERILSTLAMGHPASMSQHVNRMRREPKAAKQLKKHEKTLNSKD